MAYFYKWMFASRKRGLQSLKSVLFGGLCSIGSILILLVPIAGPAEPLSPRLQDLLIHGPKNSDDRKVCLKQTIAYKKHLGDSYSTWQTAASLRADLGDCHVLISEGPPLRVLFSDIVRFFLYVSEESLETVTTKTVRVGTERRAYGENEPHVTLAPGIPIIPNAEDDGWVRAALRTRHFSTEVWIPKNVLGTVYREQEPASHFTVERAPAHLYIRCGADVLASPGGARLASIEGCRSDDGKMERLVRTDVAGDSPPGYRLVKWGTRNELVGYVADTDVLPEPNRPRAVKSPVGRGAVVNSASFDATRGTKLLDRPGGDFTAYVSDDIRLDVMDSGEMQKTGWVQLNVFGKDGFYINYKRSREFRRTFGKLLKLGRFFTISTDDNGDVCERWTISFHRHNNPFSGEFYQVSWDDGIRTESGSDFEVTAPGSLAILGHFTRTRFGLSASGDYYETSFSMEDGESIDVGEIWYFTKPACEKALKYMRTGAGDPEKEH